MSYSRTQTKRAVKLLLTFCLLQNLCNVINGQQDGTTFTDFYYMNTTTSGRTSDILNTTVETSSTSSQPTSVTSEQEELNSTTTDTATNRSQADDATSTADVTSTTLPTTSSAVSSTEGALLSVNKSSEDNRINTDKLEYNVSDYEELPEDWKKGFNFSWPEDIHIIHEPIEDEEYLEEPTEKIVMDYYPVQNIFKQYDYVLAIIIPVGVGVALALPALVLCLVYNWAPRRRRKVVGDKQYLGQKNDKWTLLESDTDED